MRPRHAPCVPEAPGIRAHAHHGEVVMHERGFDTLAKLVSERSGSRRKALQVVGAALAGGSLGSLFSREADASAKKRCKKKGGTYLRKGGCHCAFKCGDSSSFSCNGRADCTCLRTVGGRGYCAQGNVFAFAGCSASSECATGQECIIPDCPGSGTSCSSPTDCTTAGTACINGTCQFTSCVDPCSS